MGRIGKMCQQRLLAALALLLVAASFLLPVQSASASPLTVCEPVEPTMLAECRPGSFDLDRDLNMARLEIAEGSDPRFVISRTARFSKISVGLVVPAPDGSEQVIWSHHDFEDITATFFDRQFIVALPQVDGDAEAVLVSVEGATQKTTFDHLWLAEEPPGSSRSDLVMLLIVAVFVGAMLMPILFDLVFYRVLRERFILWHAALVFSLAVQLVCSFGLYAAMIDLTLPWVRVISVGSFGFMVMAAAMFSLKFVEESKVPAWLRGTLFWLTMAHCCAALVHLAGIEALRHWPATVFFTSGLPLALAFIAFVAAALWNGSVAARFLAVGFAPLLVIALTRAITFVLPGMPTTDANGGLMVAAVIEVTATALGVADRFLKLKLERDRARVEMGKLEDAADRDALTGLLNRRAIDRRFTSLREQGFHTFALVDLDRFKQVNDRFGHQTGDAVLVACARTIQADGVRDVVAVRLGGEEFVLMVRGDAAKERIEALRQAIPRRIAADVPELDRLVTASAGVLELPADARDLMDLDAIYARADALLYEAKALGRNRLLHERIQVFERRSRRRAPARSAAA